MGEATLFRELELLATLPRKRKPLTSSMALCTALVGAALFDLLPSVHVASAFQPIENLSLVPVSTHLRVGEPLVLIIEEKVHAVCVGDISRWWVDEGGTVVNSSSTTFAASDVSEAPHILRIQIPQPPGLKPGTYNYNSAVRLQCRDNVGMIEVRRPITVQVVG